VSLTIDAAVRATAAEVAARDRIARRAARAARVARGIRWRRWALGRRAHTGHRPGREGQLRFQDRPGRLGAMASARFHARREGNRW
jgi:hypothetical protein